MSKFVKVATTDEMANQLAKHLAMDGEKIALLDRKSTRLNSSH